MDDGRAPTPSHKKHGRTPYSLLALHLLWTAVLNPTHVTAVPPTPSPKNTAVPSHSPRATFAVYGRAEFPTFYGRTPHPITQKPRPYHPFSSRATLAPHLLCTAVSPTPSHKITAVLPHSPLALHLLCTAVLNPTRVTAVGVRQRTMSHRSEASYYQKRAGDWQTNVARWGHRPQQSRKTVPEQCQTTRYSLAP